MKMAYCTLLSSEDYLDAVLVLYQSLRAVKSQYPLFVMITDKVAKNKKLLTIFNSMNIYYTIIDTLNYNIEVQEQYKDQPVLNTASKLNIFYMKQWDKLLYIDADVLVLKNLDHLFQYPNGSMLKYEMYAGEDENDTGFSGLFIVEPAQHTQKEIDFYFTLLQQAQCFDGDLLGNLWFYVRQDKRYQIPEKYLMFFDMDRTDYSDIYAIHYCNSTKPWLDRNNSMFTTPILTNELYSYYLTQVDKIKNF